MFVYICTSFCMILIMMGNMKSLNATKCNRTPEGHGASQTPADGRFHIRILENTNKYTPGKTYSIKLEGIDAGIRSIPPVKHKFSGFMLVVDRKSNDSTIVDDSTSSFGIFTLPHGDTLTKITCANMVTHTTTTPKSEIQVLWTAPQPGSGCVAFKATVIEHRDVWYMDDGPLTKDFCEDEQNFDYTLSTPLPQCRACSEAKYELTFEGLWSRNTHPKDFPSNNWVTKFSDIIGATHTNEYRFWQYGHVAKNGLQQMADNGVTKELETELKSQSEHIRTIIKAKGLQHPNVTGKTFAVFRVDPNHHLVSFVSMIDPSPDWFVGVSGMELCLENGTWAESKILDLYPWDAGTDSGPSYTSPDQPTHPRDHIRRIRSDFPNDPRSPFYDPTGADMKPLARLHLSRQRLYETSCPDYVESDLDSDPKNPCAVTPWQESSPCDAECGQGRKHQQRAYVNELAARREQCNIQLTQRSDCYGRGPNCNDESDELDEATESSCALTDWSVWSECLSSGCGRGNKTRSRTYVDHKKMKICQAVNNYPTLYQTKECFEPCSGDPSNIPKSDDNDERQEAEEGDMYCQMSEWSPFSSCSVSCGGGVKIRTRTQLKGNCDNESMKEEKPCNRSKCQIPEYCMEDPESDICDNATMNMWFFNRNFTRCDVFTWSCGSHGNRFVTNEHCLETCTGQTSEYQSGLTSKKKTGYGKRNRNRNKT